MIGEKFGRWTVLKEGPRKFYTDRWRRTWICICECGAQRAVIEQSLTGGRSQGCGCLNKGGTTHGLSNSLEYKVWIALRARCENPKNSRFSDYGGRGIKVLYKNFEHFIEDVGLRPSKQHSIDRIDNNDHYRPKNCKWSTPREQALNRRNTLRYGEHLVSDLARKYNIPANTLRARLLSGWDFEDAISRPVRPKRDSYRILNSSL